ncbi:NUDIX hydrolase, partial [Methylobacterium platani]
YEDRRAERADDLDAIAARLAAWAEAASSPEARRRRHDRIGLTFGAAGSGWNEERVLERYELLFEAGLVPEAGASPDESALLTGRPMAFDHRRMLATALGRLRGKIKYRPVVFELMPPTFTLGQLQRVVEALSGILLHKQNFRRLVAHQGLVEETEAVTAETGGRPARLMRFRREVLLERPAPGLRLPSNRIG